MAVLRRLVAVVGAALLLVGGLAAAAEATTYYHVTAAVSPIAVKPHGAYTVTGVVSPNAHGRYVYLQRYYSGGWHTVASQPLGGKSGFHFHRYGTSVPTVVLLRVYKPAAGTVHAAVSGTHKVTVTTSSFTVTAATGATGPVEVDHTFHITGSVVQALPGAAVYLQRYYSNAWHTVGSARLSASKTFDFVHYENAPGVDGYRVLKPAASTRAAGASPTVRVVVARWHYLSNMQAAEGWVDETGTMGINGSTYLHSEWWDSNGWLDTGDVQYNLSRRCYTFAATAGLDDSSAADATSQLSISGDGSSLWSGTFALGQSSDIHLDVSRVLRLALDNTPVSDPSGDGFYPGFGDPRVFCSF